jgi:hypothetical protein
MPAARELRVPIANKPGVLGQVSIVLSEAGINIEGFAVWGGVARLFVVDTDRAQELLDDEGFSCAVADVLRLHLPDEPGNLAEVAEVLGNAGINIDYAYTVTPDQPGEAAFVLAVDPKRAEGVLD